jgi:hypothetical protein
MLCLCSGEGAETRKWWLWSVEWNYLVRVGISELAKFSNFPSRLTDQNRSHVAVTHRRH